MKFQQLGKYSIEAKKFKREQTNVDKAEVFYDRSWWNFIISELRDKQQPRLLNQDYGERPSLQLLHVPI